MCFGAGALALSVQVFLLRELVVSLHGDETGFGLGLGAWLAGIAAGAAAARGASARSPARVAALAFGLLAASGPAGIAVARLGLAAVAPPPGELASIGASLVLALCVAAIPGSLVGAAFTSLAGVAAGAGEAAGSGIARLYVLEALGSLVAGLLVTFVAIPLMPPAHGVALAAAACTLLALPAARHGVIPGRAPLTILAAALAFVALPPISTSIEDATERSRFRALVPGIPLLAWSDTPYQHVAVAGDEERSLYLGGQYAASFPDPAQNEVDAHVLGCLAPRTSRVLAVGRLAYGELRFLLRHPVERLDLVEIDRDSLELVRRFLPREDAEALDDPRVRVVFDDPRRFLARGSDLYDLIAVLEPDPVTLLLSRLSTVEFYRLAAARLAPSGVFVTRVTTAPNVVAGTTAPLAGSVHGALRRSFPIVRVSPGPDALLVAGRTAEAATLDPGVLAARFRDRGIASDAFSPELLPGLFPPERIAAQEAEIARAAAAAEPSRDDRPASFLAAITVRESIARSALAPLLRAAGRARGAGVTALVSLPSLALLAWLLGRRARSRDTLSAAALHAVAVTGASGMAWSLAILFAFQTRLGALYGRIGWLTAIFMLGLAAAGFAFRSAATATREEARSRLLTAAGISLGFAIVAGPALRGIGALPFGAGAAFAGLLLLAGAATGAVFPVAAGALLAGGRSASRAAGGVEAADHAGAAVAALVTSVLLVPVLGIAGTCAALAVLQLVSFVAVLGVRSRFPT